MLIERGDPELEADQPRAGFDAPGAARRGVERGKKVGEAFEAARDEQRGSSRDLGDEAFDARVRSPMPSDAAHECNPPG